MGSIYQVNPPTLSMPFWSSMRVAVIVIGFFGMVVHFSQKTNVSIGLVCMVNHSAIKLHHVHSIEGQIVSEDDECPQLNSTRDREGPFDWPQNIQGIILGAHFWGYILTQIPGGYLAGRFGARFLFGGAIIISSTLTMFMPLGAYTHWLVFAMLQVIVGLAQGVIWPCVIVVIAHWAPVNERGKLLAFITAGAQVGSILTLSMGGLMCSWSLAGGWPLIFYLTGVVGFIWSITWIFFFTNSPRDHRFISVQEKGFLLEHTKQPLSRDQNRPKFRAPWGAILTSRVCWALFIIHTCSNYGVYTFMTSLPKYMSEVLKFDIKSNGLFSALPFVVLWLNTNFSGFLADICIRKKILTITQTRKYFSILGTILPAILLVCLSFITCRYKYIAVIILTAGLASTGFCLGGGFVLVSNDIAPAYAGIVFGISNTLATIPGIVSPYVVGALTEADPDNWRIVFFICAAMYVVGATVFTLFGSSEIQPWAVEHSQNVDMNGRLLSTEENDTMAAKMTSEA